MTTLRRLAVLAMVALLSSSGATAQETAWSFYASGYGYVVPGDDDYFQPSLTADWKSLHLEARYNYEGFDTGS